MKCDNCARDIKGEVITVSTDEGEFKFCPRCFEEDFVKKEAL
jgi:ribosome-binding protein aMBF1 (putative translation factor)